MTKTAGRGKSVYGRAGGWPVLAPLALLAASPPSCAVLPAACAPRRAPAPISAATVLDAREALRKRDRNRLAALRAAGRGRGQSARALGRVLGAEQPPGRGAAGRADRVRRALERQLRRGPAAQRLAARARPAPRLGQLQRRVPALSHGRRPRGHLLLAGHRADRRPRHQGRGHRRLDGAEGRRRRLRPARRRRWSTPSR